MNSISILNFIQNKKNQKEAKQIVNNIEEIEQIEQTIEDDIEQIQTDITAETAARTIADAEINRKVDILYKISEGVLWDIEQREESGAAQLPKGGEYGNIDEVRGRTEQGENPAPDNPQEIVSVDNFVVRHTDADGNTLEERTITPPHPLNAIREYRDKLDVVNGVWEYINAVKVYNGSQRWEKGGSGALYTAEERTIISSSVLGLCDKFTLSASGTFPRMTLPADGYIRIWNFNGDANVLMAWLALNPMEVVYPVQDTVTEPVSPDDLEWLRNLTLEEGENLFVTDNHGRDVSYLMSDFINLKKAVE